MTQYNVAIDLRNYFFCQTIITLDAISPSARSYIQSLLRGLCRSDDLDCGLTPAAIRCSRFAAGLVIGTLRDYPVERLLLTYLAYAIATVQIFNMPSKRVFFENSDQIRLSGILELTPEQPRAYALFSHCFTCSKDLKAIVRISRALAKHGICVLRFDFTGLGDSKGDFSETNFDNNCADLMAATEFLSNEYEPPKVLIGHSLGGAAMMYRCGQIESAQAIVTIASPSSTQHLANFLSTTNPDIESKGEGQVEIGGRTWTLKRQLIENLRSVDLETAIKNIRISHLILHPPDDETLQFWHAEKLFEFTGGAKAMFSIDGADHLLVKQSDDVGFVADLINLWSSRFLKYNTVQ